MPPPRNGTTSHGSNPAPPHVSSSRKVGPAAPAALPLTANHGPRVADTIGAGRHQSRIWRTHGRYGYGCRLFIHATTTTQRASKPPAITLLQTGSIQTRTKDARKPLWPSGARRAALAFSESGTRGIVGAASFVFLDWACAASPAFSASHASTVSLRHNRIFAPWARSALGNAPADIHRRRVRPPSGR